MYTLHEKTIHEPDSIACRFLMPDPKETGGVDVLILSVAGNYPDGSRGRDHAEYISVMAVQGLQAFNPDAVILDLRDLHYRWGNSLLAVLQDISRFADAEREEDEPYFPIVAAVSEKSRAAFLSLVTPAGGDEPNWCFDDLEPAIKAAAIAGKAWLDY